MTNKFTSENAGENNKSIKRQAPIFSRRGFFTLAGALASPLLLTSFWEGFLIHAYADETGKTSYRLYFTHRWQVPICFLDTKDASDPKGIPSASIRITSKDTNKSVTATTDDLGIAIVDIREMVAPIADKNKRAETSYTFNGSILAKANNYRTYEVRKKCFYGGEELNIASEPYSGRPYLQMACIDDWDIQYEKEVTFTASSKNDVYHEVVIKVEDVAGLVDVTLYQDEGGKTTIKEVLAKNGIATATASLKLLSTDKKHAKYALVPDKPVKIKVDIKDDPSKSFEVITNAVVQAAIEEDEYSKSDFELSLDSFIQKVQDVVPITIPTDFPVLGGEYFRCNNILPSWPVAFVVDPQGFFQAGVGYSAEYFKSEEGWKKNTFQNKLEELKQIEEDWNRLSSTRKNNPYTTDYLIGDKYARFGKLPLAKSFSVNFQVGGLILLAWGEALGSSKAAYVGNARLYFYLSGNAAFTQQLILGELPVFLRLELSADSQLFLNAECELEKGAEYPKLSSGSVPFIFKPEIALTAGLGIADFASVGVRGVGYLSVSSTISAGAPTKANPHVVVGAGIQASVVIQVALFKYSYEVYSYDQPSLYDNAKTTKALQSGTNKPNYTHDAYLIKTDSGLGYSAATNSSGLLKSGGLTSLGSFTNAIPVSQSELSKSAEFKASAAPLKNTTSATTSTSNGTDPNSLYTYTPTKQQGMKATPAQGLQSLGNSGAVMLGNPLYEQAFSDPRMKVVNVNGTPWLLRILSVTYNVGGSSETRTRLAVAKWNNANSRWDSAQVIDFEPSYSSNTNQTPPERIDLFDYDFSALSADETDNLDGSWADGSVVRVFLISGTRNQSETSTVGEALAHTVGTFLCLDENLIIKTSMSFLDVYAKNAVGNTANAMGKTYSHSTLACPTVLSAGTSKENNLTVVFAFCRAAETADALAAGPYAEWPATALFDSAGNSLVAEAFACAEPGQTGYTDKTKEFLTTKKSSLSLDIIGCNYADESKSEITQVRIGGHYVSLDSNGSSVVRNFIVLRNTIGQNDSGELLVNQSGAVSNIAHFVAPWRAGGLGGALFGSKSGLRSRTFKSSASLDYVVTDVSLAEGIDLSHFAIDQSSGTLYYITVREGIVPGSIQEDGTIGSDQTVKEYRIWASRYVTIGTESGFIEPFSLITTTDPIDTLTYVDMGDAYGFAVNSITSMADSTSTIMFYHLPFIRSVKLLDFRSATKFVSVGERNAFLLTIQNEGNVAITSFTLSLQNTDNKDKEYLINIDLSDSTQVVPHNNPEDVSSETDTENSEENSGASYKEPTFDLATKAGILNPGKKRTYMWYWDVPDEFSGATELKIKVVGSANAEADDAPGVASVEPSRFRNNALPIEVLGLSHEPVECEIDFRSDDMESVEGDVDSLTVGNSRYIYADGETTGGGSGNTGGKGATNLAPTGDDSLSSTAAAALLAGLGLAGLGTAAFGAKSEPEPDEE